MMEATTQAMENSPRDTVDAVESLRESNWEE
jgi:hypothetical protein